jgi:hypothetical protein
MAIRSGAQTLLPNVEKRPASIMPAEPVRMPQAALGIAFAYFLAILSAVDRLTRSRPEL